MMNLLFKRTSRVRSITLIITLLVTLLTSVPVHALPTTAEQVKQVVQYWLHMDETPLSADMGNQVGSVVTYDDDAGDPLYHVVTLEPDGYVIVSGDDRVEPIIAFVPQGKYDPSPEHPLGALVNLDVPQRVAHVRTPSPMDSGMDTTAAGVNKAREKWVLLNQPVPFAKTAVSGLAGVDDERVPPFVQSRWNQKEEASGLNCYNLYTPNNYYAGCVATAMAQVMRHHEHPTSAVGTHEFTITVDGADQNVNLLGGDGSGGTYNWADMDFGPYVPDAGHRQAIGRLTHDAGASVGMAYTPDGSSASMFTGADQLIAFFDFETAKKGLGNWYENLPEVNLNTMVNPNLDAGFPVMFSVKRQKPDNTWGGHVVIGDGYGYHQQTLYHHLNMGWSGSSDAWYNLPDIETTNYHYTVLDGCVYNLFPSGTGEIISGRVTDSSGTPIENAAVTAVRTGGGTYHATTNSQGIYALAKIPASSEYAVSVAPVAGKRFSSQTVSTGASVDRSTTVGNVWGVDFSPGDVPEVTTQAVTNITQTTATGHGTMVSLGIPLAHMHGVCWNTAGNPTLSDSYSNEGSAAVGAFTSAMTGLSPGTTYYVRAWAFNDSGTSYGNEVSFTTDPAYTAPIVSTIAVTDVGAISATANGSVISMGHHSLITEHGFCWDVNPNPLKTGNCTRQGAMFKPVSFTGSITGLIPGETYYLRAYAVNGTGTSYGGQKIFTTDPSGSPVLTGAVSDISTTMATGNGYIDLSGGGSVSQHGVCWGKSGNPTLSDSFSEEGGLTKTASFTTDIKGLGAGITYYVRAYATGPTGTTVYGNEVSFSTPSYPSVSTQPATDVTSESAVGHGTVVTLGSPHPTRHGFCWNTGGTPNLSDPFVEIGPVDATGAFTADITGLLPGTRYCVRAYAVNAAGTRYGQEIFLRTENDSQAPASLPALILILQD